MRRGVKEEITENFTDVSMGDEMYMLLTAKYRAKKLHRKRVVRSKVNHWITSFPSRTVIRDKGRETSKNQHQKVNVHPTINQNRRKLDHNKILESTFRGCVKYEKGTFYRGLVN